MDVILLLSLIESHKIPQFLPPSIFLFICHSETQERRNLIVGNKLSVFLGEDGEKTTHRPIHPSITISTQNAKHL
jgi:hypothetical protein